MIGSATRGGRVRARGGFVIGIILGVIGLAAAPLAAGAAGGQRQGGPGPRAPAPPVATAAGARVRSAAPRPPSISSTTC